MARWRVTLYFGTIKLETIEQARAEITAIESALRYARAQGYKGQPTRTFSRRIEPCVAC